MQYLKIRKRLTNGTSASSNERAQIDSNIDPLNQALMNSAMVYKIQYYPFNIYY